MTGYHDGRGERDGVEDAEEVRGRSALEAVDVELANEARDGGVAEVASQDLEEMVLRVRDEDVLTLEKGEGRGVSNDSEGKKREKRNAPRRRSGPRARTPCDRGGT